jgi:DNA-binding CsgD family transcriptional regulator
MFELDFVERGRAWALVASGERSRGLTALRSAADRAAAGGLIVVEALLRHDLARLGDAKAEVDRLAGLGQQIDGALGRALAAHAGALVAGDGRELAASADRLAALGVDLLAAEAAVDASAALRVDGLRRKAAEYAGLADRLMEACGNVRSVAMPVEVDLVALTEREREVATMAARGMSNREIADVLFLSSRTVENHLQRIYDKLGISGREHLGAVLAP